MKMSKLCVAGMIVAFIGSIMLLKPITAVAFNPQPEPPGKQKGVKINPGSTKSGIAIEDKQPASTKPKNPPDTGSTKSGIVVEDKKTAGAFAPQPEPPKQADIASPGSEKAVERINESAK